MISKLCLLILMTLSINAEETSSSLTRQKFEVIELKKELNNFYKEKEQEYQERKKELESILAQIQKEKSGIKNLHDKNLEILQDIKLEIESKTSKIYNSMKPKIAADIFNQMISEGKIDDVFDILIKLKESNVTQIMKFLSVSNASVITQMLENYNVKNEKNVGEMLKMVTPQDYVKYGLIPEFVGRVPVSVSLDLLDEDALMQILSQPKSSICKQYKRLFELDGVELEFEPEALRAMAKKAMTSNTGARGLRTIMEEVVVDLMYEIPSDDSIVKCVITKEVVDDGADPILTLSDEPLVKKAKLRKTVKHHTNEIA